MKKDALLKRMIAVLTTHKELILASAIAAVGARFVILGDPWDSDIPWL